MRKRIPKKDSEKFDKKKYVSNRGYSRDKAEGEGLKKSYGSKSGHKRDDDNRGGRFDGPKKTYGDNQRGGRLNDDRKKSFGDDRRSSGRDDRGRDDRRSGGRFDGPKKTYGDNRSDDRGGNRYGDRKKTYGDDRRSFGNDRRSSGGDDRRTGGRDDNRGNRYDDRKKGFGNDRRSFGSDDKRNSGTDDRRDRGRFGGKPQEKHFDNDRDRNADEKPSFKKFGAKKEVDEEIIKKSLDRQVGDPTPPRFDEKRIQSRLPPRVQQKLDTNKKEDDIRLNKYIANAGLCSRREADELISSGMIKVNGKVVTEMGYKVKPNDTVKYGKDILSREKMMYVLLNKPKDFITTMDDPQERRTVMELVAGACRERIYPVGRLDRNTTGLLLLTNDGELTEKLTHPSSELTKIYQAELDKSFEDDDFEKLKEGVELEDGMIKPDDLAMVTPDGFVVGLKIHSGKNRVVRRMFEHLGYEVMKLDRTTFAGLTKKDLPRGKWRFLNEKEIIRLKYLI